MSARTANTVTEEGGLLVVYMAKHQTRRDMEELKARIINTAHRRDKDLDILVDVSAVKTSEEGANVAARTFFKDLPFRHMAVYGGSKIVSVGIKLTLNLFISPGVGEVKFFKTEEKARTWLAEQYS